MNIAALGRFFYRRRSFIAVPFFLLLIFFSRPDEKIILPHFFILPGLILRLWATGYIGEKSRGKELTAEYRIISGPFGYFRHPLYIGNFLLVLGVIFLYNPPVWLGTTLVAIFLFEYSMIIYVEEKTLKRLPTRNVRFSIKNLKSEFSTWGVMLSIYLIYLLLIPAKKGILKI
jgi:hypothetical protein